ncbi:hypothetical protein EVAR_94310_1 [Eumeta japonica]|uniref:Uncharacterized protein n=1 Tax=Eumeta variegata TaxID=151549 RepID=A0A4C1UF26_EUMVA|nr:hypothetical protein EVAR_94310_1 [Eumeta japonica]
MEMMLCATSSIDPKYLEFHSLSTAAELREKASEALGAGAACGERAGGTRRPPHRHYGIPAVTPADETPLNTIY